MAPNVAPKGNARAEITPQAVKAALSTLAAAQRQALEGSRWVGTNFASQARAMHVGDQDQVPIHGQATVQEAKALVEEGVPVVPLPLPVLPPEQTN